jgi:hypothetical protein
MVLIYSFKLTLVFSRSVGDDENHLFSDPNAALVHCLSHQLALSSEKEGLLHTLIAPFKLLVLRSAQQVPRVARASSMRRLPKDLCRMVGEMFSSS